MTIFSPEPINKYESVSSNFSSFEPIEIVDYTPIISKNDRLFGEIQRFFVKFKTHNSPSDIIEVDENNFNKIKDNNFYQTTSIRWKISGNLDDLPNEKLPVKFMPGIITANKKSVELGNEELPGLKEYITDYKRFWKF